MPTPTMSDNIRLLIDCPDHRGVVAAVSNFIALHQREHRRTPTSTSATRRAAGSSCGWRSRAQGFGLGRDEFDAAFSPLARQHGMTWRVRFTDRP